MVSVPRTFPIRLKYPNKVIIRVSNVKTIASYLDFAWFKQANGVIQEFIKIIWGIHFRPYLVYFTTL